MPQEGGVGYEVMLDEWVQEVCLTWRPMQIVCSMETMTLATLWLAKSRDARVFACGGVCDACAEMV